MPGIQDAQRALLVVAVEPCGIAMPVDRITALFEKIPGIGALRVENAVQIPGGRLRLLGSIAPSPPHARAGDQPT